MSNIPDELIVIAFILGIIFVPPVIYAICSALYERTKTSINKKAKDRIENEIKKKIEEETQILNQDIERLKEKISNLEYIKNGLDESISQKYPFLAESISKSLKLRDINAAKYLERKRFPAYSTAKEIKAYIANEKEKAILKSLEYKHQMEFYEYICPWLVRLKSMNPQDVLYLVQSKPEDRDFDEKEYNRKWLELERFVGDDFPSNEKIRRLTQEKYLLEKEINELKRKEELLLDLKSKITGALTQDYPFLSESISEYTYYFDLSVADYLETKIKPAFSTASEIKNHLAYEKKEYKRLSLAYKHQLDFYENLFPWLLDFKELPPGEAIVFADDPEKAFAQSSEKNWLSPDEFKNLSSVEKSQLALDRWKSRSKTKWEIGIEYEQYIGYILESNEYRVEYQGAKLGLEDMGIDLIAEKNGITWLIQCKRWNEKKTIHEKHIFQLYGSKVLYELQHPEKQVFARFVTAEDNLSELAKQCADKLNVIVDVKPHKEYPLIKCNINNGQKIYHLPMDQQYHNVIIDRSKKEKYVWTAKEAEEEGFQRAKKHLF